MARQGIGQFIDLGCGLPAATSACAAVQKINPCAQVLYVDHDPVVIVHASALLTGATTSVLLADVRDPDALLAAVRLDGLIDLTIPTGLLCTAALDHLPDRDDPWGCLAHMVSALAPGSYLALSHLTGDEMMPPPDGGGPG
jgi:trans-aconitate methyltransferase